MCDRILEIRLMPADKAHYKGEGAFGWRDPDRIHLIDSFYLDHGRWRRSARSGRRSPRFKHEPVDSGEESVAVTTLLGPLVL
jgi:hypothetical protein